MKLIWGWNRRGAIAWPSPTAIGPPNILLLRIWNDQHGLYLVGTWAFDLRISTRKLLTHMSCLRQGWPQWPRASQNNKQLTNNDLSESKHYSRKGLHVAGKLFAWLMIHDDIVDYSWATTGALQHWASRLMLVLFLAFDGGNHRWV